MIKQPDLGKKIAALRNAKGLTQEELVDKCNLNVRTLQRIESGEVTPRTHTIRVIFEKLDFPLEKTQNNKGSKLKWLEQLYICFIDLFNLKTNTMKKISILTGIVTLLVLIITSTNSEIKAQKIKKNTNKKTETAYTTNSEMAIESFWGIENFDHHHMRIGKDGEIMYKGTRMEFGLISINKLTRDFSLGYTCGKFMDQGVEIIIEKDILDDFRFEADTVFRSDSTIILKSDAKLIYGDNEGVIETAKILITLE